MKRTFNISFRLTLMKKSPSDFRNVTKNRRQCLYKLINLCQSYTRLSKSFDLTKETRNERNEYDYIEPLNLSHPITNSLFNKYLVRSIRKQSHF